MIRGIYTSTSGMMGQVIQQETIANNLSNLDTTGYKREDTVFHSFPDMLIRSNERFNDVNLFPNVGNMNLGSLVEENHTVHTQGHFAQSESSLDFALEGEGFFTVLNPEGEVRFTRDGHFLRDEEGNLVTSHGYHVLGEDEEPLTIPEENVVVDTDGVIRDQEDEVVGELLVTGFANPETLRKEGDNLLAAVDESELLDPGEMEASVRQGFLEGSNIDMVKEISRAMTSLRQYEANQKAVHAHDELLNKSVNEVGVLR